MCRTRWLTAALVLLALPLAPVSARRAEAGPYVTISAPSPASGTVSVVVKATTRLLGRLEIYRDGTIVKACTLTVTPCTWSWNTTLVNNGVHTVSAKRVTTSNTVLDTASLEVMVQNGVSDSTPPSVTASVPATASGTVTLTALATDASGVTTTRLYLNGYLIASTSGGSLSHTGDSRKVPNGTYAIQATATDPKGNTGASPIHYITVNNSSASDSTPPSVTASVPATASGIVTLSASATDASGVATTRLYLDGYLIASTSGGSLSHTGDSRDVPDGTYAIQATATDTKGNTGASPIYYITVDNNSTSPTPAAPPPSAPPASAAVPTTYNVTTDRTTRPKPALPAMGLAGTKITDPTFGTKILRVTDANTQPYFPNRPYFTSSSAEQNVWNTDSTIFYVQSSGGESVAFQFNKTAMTATKIGTSYLPIGGEPAFSFTDPNILYGIGGSNGRTLMKYSFATGATTTVLNLDALVPGLSGSTGNATVGANGLLVTYFGGPVQDTHFYVGVYDPATGTAKVLNTVNGTINGAAASGMSQWNWRIHNARIDKSGRFVVITDAGGAPSPLIVWDLQTGQVKPITVNPWGHKVGGYGMLLNQDVISGSTWDGFQWLKRSLAALTTPVALVNPVLTPSGYGSDSHLSWNNAQPSTQVPVLISTFREAAQAGHPWRAWDEEIIALRTDGGSSTVWRFAHHRSKVTQFEDMPRGNVSQDGRWFLFTSNWEGTLGTSVWGVPRQDVFIVQLSAP